jgi:uncharacterized membrane protein YhaH (DUF805 family)
MQTQQEFAENAKVFRTRTEAMGVFLVLALFAFLIGGLALTISIQRMHIIGKNSPWWGLGLVLLFGFLILLPVINNRFCRSAALRCGLQCSKCLNVMKPVDLKILTATHNCPYCGVTFFQ